MDYWKRILLISLCTAPGIGSADPLQFKGLPMGSSKSELLARFPILECRRVPPSFTSMGDEICTPSLECRTAACQESERSLSTYAGAPTLTTTFNIVAGAFVGFKINIVARSYEATREAMKLAYGIGKEEVVPMVRSNGARLNSRFWIATSDQGSASLTEFDGRADESAAAIATNALLEWRVQRKRGDPEKNKADL